jgi:hypothetical protein
MHRSKATYPAIRPAARMATWLCAVIALCGPMAPHAEMRPTDDMRLAALVPPPAEPAFRLRLAAAGSFNVPAARAGDTVLYRLRVEWDDIPAAVMLMPSGELEAPGFLPAGVSTLHRKSTVNGTVMNVTTFTYRLVAREAGTAKVAPFTLRYHNGLTGREEGVSVAGTFLEIAPGRKPLMQRTGIRILGVLVIIAALAGLWRRLSARRRLRQQNGETDVGALRNDSDARVSSGLSSLKRRCDTAESRVWLTDAERLCTEFLCRRLGVANPAQVRFEAALDQYLGRNTPAGPGEAAAWSKLRDLFHEARYSGARLEPHELRNACRHLSVCLQPASLQPSSLHHQGEQPS